MPTESENAVVLAEDALVHDAATFVGMPGVYAPGNPVLLTTIGLDADEALERIESLGLPLVLTSLHGDETPAVPDENPPRAIGNLGFGEVAPGVRPVDVPEPAIIEGQEPAEPAGRALTKAELVTAGEALGLTDLSERQTRDELAAAVEAAGGTSVAPPEPPTNDGGSA